VSSLFERYLHNSELGRLAMRTTQALANLQAFQRSQRAERWWDLARQLIALEIAAQRWSLLVSNGTGEEQDR